MPVNAREFFGDEEVDKAYPIPMHVWKEIAQLNVPSFDTVVRLWGQPPPNAMKYFKNHIDPTKDDYRIDAFMYNDRVPFKHWQKLAKSQLSYNDVCVWYGEPPKEAKHLFKKKQNDSTSL